MSKMTIANEEAVKAVLDDIFDNFDFEKVKVVMDALDWRWDLRTSASPPDEKMRVPTLDEIKKVAADLLWNCANDPANSVIGTGGFRVEKDFSDPNDPWMCLTFEVTDWDAAASEIDE